VITGVLYLLAVTGISQLVFREKANGILLKKEGRILGERRARQDTKAKQVRNPRYGSAVTIVSSASLKRNNLFLVEAGDAIAADGEVVDLALAALGRV